LLLRRRGLNVIYLGANVPFEQFSNTVQDLRADLVVLVAQQLITAATLQHTALLLSSKHIPVAFGGRIFGLNTGLADSISGYFLGESLPAAVDQIELILNGRVKLHHAKATTAPYVAAHQAFVSRRAQIELKFQQLLEPLLISPEDLKTGIHFLGENISAALQLGDLSYVSAEVDWLKVLLQSHDTEPRQLIHFMEAYSQAVNKNINGQGKPISEWLANEVEKLKT
jgi:hypothetical protein